MTSAWRDLALPSTGRTATATTNNLMITQLGVNCVCHWTRKHMKFSSAEPDRERTGGFSHGGLAGKLVGRPQKSLASNR